MYSTTPNNVTLFVSEQQKENSTEKCRFATVSESVKDDRAENGRRYDSWDARFVGEACKKLAEMENPDKTRIVLTAWNAVNPYIKPDESKGETRGHKAPYLMVMDFEIRTNDGDGAEAQ